MTDQSIFTESKETPQTPAQETPAAPQEPAQASSPSPESLFADQLAQIRNEKGEPKYRDANTALEALRHSQEYIPQLKSENETLKEKVARLEAEAQERQRIEEQLERFASQRQDPAPQGEAGLTPEQVQQMLEQHLTQREQQSIAASNLQQVEQAAREKFGEKASEEIKRLAESNGMSLDEMRDYAAKHPKLVLSMFSTPTQRSSTPTGSYNVPPINSPQPTEVAKPDRSMLAGASTKQVVEHMRAHRASVYAKYGITE